MIKTVMAIMLGVLLGCGALLLQQSLWPTQDSSTTKISSSAKQGPRLKRLNARRDPSIHPSLSLSQSRMNEARLSEEIARLREDIRSIEGRLSADPSDKDKNDPNVDDAGHEEAIAMPLDEEAVREKVRHMQEEQSSAFLDEARDPQWASQAENDFANDFGQTLQSEDFSGTLQNVECRSSRCIAKIAWPSFDEAAKQHGKFAQSPMTQNCRVMSFMPRSVEQPDAEYQHELFFRCNSAEPNDNEPT